MKQSFWITSAAAAALIGGGPTTASALVIDTFVETQAVGVAVGGPNTAFGSITGSMLGGERDVFVERTDANGEAAVDVNFTENEALNHQQAFSTRGYSSYTYDGIDGSNDLALPGLGGVDLTEGGSGDSFYFDLLGTDRDATFAFDVFSLTGHSRLSTSVGPDTSGMFFLPFASFLLVNGTGADFTSVEAIRFTIDGTGPMSNGLDAVVAEIGTNGTPVPEPGTLALLGSAFFGYGWKRRREGLVAA